MPLKVHGGLSGSIKRIEIDRKGGAKSLFMKNVILIFTYVVIGALTLGIIVSLMGREARNVELQSNLSNAVEESLANAMEEKNYTIADQNEFLADVTENITEVLDTNSTVDVKVMKADLNKGLLSLRVVESFNYVNGKTGSVKCDRTVVFDKRGQDAEDKYDVYYYISADDDRPYKRYTLLKGDTILVPKEPSRAGYTFEGWKDADGNAPLSDQIVESELTMWHSGLEADSRMKMYWMKTKTQAQRGMKIPRQRKKGEKEPQRLSRKTKQIRQSQETARMQVRRYSRQMYRVPRKQGQIQGQTQRHRNRQQEKGNSPEKKCKKARKWHQKVLILL